MNKKKNYELAASVCGGKVVLSNSSFNEICRIHRYRILRSNSDLEKAIEQGRYAIFKLEQTQQKQFTESLLKYVIFLLDEAIRQLLIAETKSRINNNRYACLISLFREKQNQARSLLEEYQ